MPSDNQPTSFGMPSDTAASGFPPANDLSQSAPDPALAATGPDPLSPAMPADTSAVTDPLIPASADPANPPSSVPDSFTTPVDPATGLPAEAPASPLQSTPDPFAPAASLNNDAQPDPLTGLPADPLAPTEPLPSTMPSAEPDLMQASVLNPPPPATTTTTSDSGSVTPPSGGGSGDNIVSSPHVPEKYGGKKVIATIFGIFLLVGAVAAGVTLVGKIQEVREKASGGTGNIAIFKTICDKIGDQDVCNGRDSSLGNYKVDFQVHEGANDQGPVVQTITVTISDNNNGNGNTGNASQGRSVGGALNAGSYTVCEIPIAYNASGDRVPLEVEPRPEASHGGSSGGTNQKEFNSQCITVDLNSGEAELKYLDKRKGPAPTATPAPTSTPTPTKPPQATNTPTPKPTVTPTLPPQITAECFDVIVYDSNWQQLSSNSLSSLKAGDKVRLTVAGQTSSGSFSKARFTVNGTMIGETSTKKPSSDSYYVEYTIPSGVVNFTIKGELFHSSLGWI